MLHARTRFPTTIFASRATNPARRTAVFTGRLTILLFYYFSNSTVTALANKNARTLHARARFSAKMRGRSTRKSDFRRECERSTRERDFRRECEDAPRESAILGENVRMLHARTRFPTRIFASRATNPARRTAVFTGRLTILLF